MILRYTGALPFNLSIEASPFISIFTAYKNTPGACIKKARNCFQLNFYCSP